MQYHAIVRAEGKVKTVEFVDAPGCQTFAGAGESVEAVAQEALEGWIEAHLVAGRAVPMPKRAPRSRAGQRVLRVRVPLKLAVRAALVTRRVVMGYSQAQVAQRMNVTRQAYQQLESPDANLRIETLARALEALDAEAVFSLETAVA
ncbi:MAG: helix-turn-helix domain-containing protein [Gemmatimonadetes bacterium]|nr:helix-turn-helix domain-containing protein [Gemmatimonadota bacterium]